MGLRHWLLGASIGVAFAGCSAVENPGGRQAPASTKAISRSSIGANIGRASTGQTLAGASFLSRRARIEKARERAMVDADASRVVDADASLREGADASLREGASASRALDGDPAPQAPEYLPLPENRPTHDALHYRLELDFPPESLETPRFSGAVEITFKPIEAGMRLLRLDSAGLSIARVQLLNTLETLPFAQAGESLEIDLGAAYAPADTLTVRIEYGWENGEGMYFRARDGKSGVEAIYSQSEPEMSRHWFPGNSHPNDKATIESLIRVPRPFVAVSNGALVETIDEGATRVFHWSQRIPVVSYLYVVTAGRFGVERTTWKGVPVEYYGAWDDMDRVAYSLRRTPEMLDHFSRINGFNYPYEKYAQVAVPQYQWGGMEHSSATTLTDRTLHSSKEEPEISSDGLVAHELAHQWFGDLVTCRNWDHLWINEGFATYWDQLFLEKSRGRDALIEELSGYRDWYLWEEAEENGGLNARPVVFPYFTYSEADYFDSHAYAKGAWVLHMLRGELGDDTFFKGIRHYLHRHQGTLVATEDFRRAMEEASGRELGWFFEQWLYRPGFPKFAASWRVLDDQRLEISVEQTQDTALPGGLAGTTPLFRGKLPVEIGGVVTSVELSGLAKETFAFGPGAFTPTYVRLNAGNAWLSAPRTEHADQSAWLAQLRESPFADSRVEAASAIDALAQAAKPVNDPATDPTADPHAAVVPALATCARTDSSSWARATCVTVLADLPNSPSVLAFAEEAPTLAADPDPAIRTAALHLLGRLPVERTMAVLRARLLEEDKIEVLTRAIQETSRVNGPGAYDLIVAQLGRASFQDRIRGAVLAALATLADMRSLDAAEQYAQPGHSESLRFGAFHLLAALGKKDPAQALARARATLEPAAESGLYRIRREAIRTLGKLGSPESLPLLRRIAEGDPDGRLRREAAAAIREIEPN